VAALSRRSKSIFLNGLHKGCIKLGLLQRPVFTE
jgi:hypothetical protein